jgi:sulfur-carrier protein
MAIRMSREVAVRLFAAARDSAGTTETSVSIPESSEGSAVTVGEILGELAERYGGTDGRLEFVILRCSFLLDGRQARRTTLIGDAAVLDVLPPFAGG